jgi:hypothetical protein
MLVYCANKIKNSPKKKDFFLACKYNNVVLLCRKKKSTKLYPINLKMTFRFLEKDGLTQLARQLLCVKKSKT